MDFKNCKECGKVFRSNGISKICPKCELEDGENYEKVKEYIYDHPGATLPEVSEKTDVSEERILYYLREGRLEIIGTSSMILDCERCGRGITTGRYCKECASELERGLKSGFSQIENKKPTSRSKNRMYTAEIKNKNK